MGGTGVKLVGLKLQNLLLPESLPAGNYVLGRNGHVVGVCVREDGGLEVYDSQDTDGIGEFCFADYFCAWKLSSKELERQVLVPVALEWPVRELHPQCFMHE